MHACAGIVICSREGFAEDEAVDDKRHMEVLCSKEPPKNECQTHKIRQFT